MPITCMSTDSRREPETTAVIHNKWTLTIPSIISGQRIRFTLPTYSMTRVVSAGVFHFSIIFGIINYDANVSVFVYKYKQTFVYIRMSSCLISPKAFDLAITCLHFKIQILQRVLAYVKTEYGETDCLYEK